MKTPEGAAGVLCLLSALVWAAALQMGDRPGEESPLQLLVLAAGLVILATAALVALVVRGSPWGRRLAGGMAVGELGLAMGTPLSSWWWAGVVLAGATLALVAGPWPRDREARRAAQLGPPPRAVLLLCLLASLPVVLAAVSRNGMGGGWVLAGVAAVTAPAYAKALPGALFSARFLIPVTAVAAVFTTPWPGWPAALVVGAAATGTAWSTEARLAVRPLVDTGPPPAPEPTPLRIRSATQPSRGRSDESRGG